MKNTKFFVSPFLAIRFAAVAMLLAAVGGFALKAQAQVTTQPTDQSVNIGGTATYTIVATSATAWQWRKNGANISNGATGNGSTYAGATTATLTITGVTPQDAAIATAGFDCVITGGSNPTSSRVALVARLFRFPLTEVYTGSLTTSASDPDSGTNITINMINSSGTASDFHGKANSGVAGIGAAFDLTTDNNSGGVTTQPNGSAKGPLAWINGGLNFGTLSKFTVSEWFNVESGATSLGTAGDNPRMFVLGSSGSTDSSLNDFAMKLGDGSDTGLYGMKANFNNSDEALNSWTNTTPLANTWFFLAITYDGSTLTYYIGATNSASATFGSAQSISGSTFAIGTSGVLMIGNRESDFERTFAGWIGDVRCFSGVSAGLVENARLLGVTAGPANTATAGSSQVSLTWSAVTMSGVTGSITYNIKRGTVSGGPYTLLTAGTGVSGTSFTDSTAVNGNTYYYVVAPVNSAGEGHPGAQSSATPACSSPTATTPTASVNPSCSGTSVTVTETASGGSTPYSYQWSKGGTAISSATSSTYAYTPVNGDSLTCAVTSGCGGSAATSSALVLTVNGTPTTATVGGTQNICGSLVSSSLGGNTPSVGTGAWSQTSGPGTTTFSNSGSGSSTATVTTPGTYVFTWTISNGACAPSTASVTVNYYATPTTATVGGTQNICGSLVSSSLGGNTPTVGTGAWSQTSGPGTTTFSNSGSGSSTATVTTAGTYVFTWTISNGACSSSTASVTVNYYATPTTAMVGGTQNICGSLVSSSLGGNTPTVGTGAWSQTSGPGTTTFSNSGSGSSTATVSVAGTYVFTWTISNGTCTPSTASVTVNYYATPTTATVGGTQNFCGSLVSSALGGNTPTVGTGAWSQTSGPGTTTFSNSGSGSSTATVTAYGTYTFTWTISNGTCTPSTASVTVNYYATPDTATVGGSQNICGSLVSSALGGNTPVVGTGAWSQTSGPGTANFSNSSSGSSTATVSVPGTYVFTWTISNGTCTPSTASVTVNYYAVPTIGSQPSSTAVCPSVTASFTVGPGNTTSPQYQWYVIPAGDTVTNLATGGSAESATYVDAPTLQANNGDQYYAVISSGLSCGNSATSSIVTLTVTTVALITAEPSPLTVCVGQPTLFSVIASGSGLSYQWLQSGDGGVTFTNAYEWTPGASTNATYTNEFTDYTNNQYQYFAYVTNSCLGLTNSVTNTLTVNPLPATFNVTGSGGTDCANGSGFDIGLDGSTNDGVTSYQLMVGAAPIGPPQTGTGSALDFGFQNAAGTYTVVASNTVTTCIATMNGSAMIVLNPVPTAAISGSMGIFEGGSATLSVALGGSSGPWNVTWSDGAVSNNVSTTPLTRVVSPTVTTTYSVTTVTDTGTGCSQAGTGSATVSVGTAYVITPATITATAGSGTTITVSLVDSSDNAVAASGSRSLTFSGLTSINGHNPTVAGMGLGSVSLTFSGGAASGSLIAYDANGGAAESLSVSDATVSSGNSGGSGASVTVNPAAANKLVFTSAPVSTTAGTASSSITVQRQDQYGNPNTGQGETTRSVTLSSSSTGTVTFNPASPATIANGVSTTSFTYTDTQAGNPTITVASTSPSTITSATQVESITPSSPNMLAMAVQPSTTASAGVAFVTQPIVFVEDSNGNIISNSTVTVMATQTSGGNISASSGNSVSVNAVNGVATFSGLYLTNASTVTLTFTSSGLANTVSGNVADGAGPVSQLVITSAPVSATAGTASSSITVQRQDQYGNPNTGQGETTRNVNLSSTSTGTVTFNPTSPTTIANGASTTSFTYKDTQAGNPTVTAASTSPSTVTSATQTESITPGSPNKLAMAVQPSTTANAGVAFVTQPIVFVEDSNGNIISNSTVSVAANQTSGGNISATSGNSVSVNAVSGVATFSGLYLTNVSTVTLTFTSSSLTSAVSSSIADSAGPVSKLVITSTAVSVAAGTASGNITVQRQDQYGNPNTAESTRTISLSSTSTGTVTFSPSSPTIANGASTTTFTYTDTKSGSPIVTAASTSPSTVTSATQTETITAGSVVSLIWATPPPASYSPGAIISPSPVIKTADQYGNPSTTSLGTQQIIYLAFSGAGALSGTTVFDIGTSATNSQSGSVTCTNLSVSTPGAGDMFTVAPGNGLVPTNITPCVVWLDASDTSTLTGNNPVTAWNDKSGYGNNYNHQLTIGTPTLGNILSTFATNAINGHNTVYFPGNTSAAGYSLGTTSLNITTNSLSAFVVFTKTANCETYGRPCAFTSTGNDDHDNSNGSFNFDLHNTDQITLERNNNEAVVTGVSIANGTPYLAEGVFSNNVNQASYVLGKANSGADVNTISLGNLNITWASIGSGLSAGASITGGDAWGGNIAEFLLYTNAISAANHVTVDTYLTNKWFPLITNNATATFTIAAPAPTQLTYSNAPANPSTAGTALGGAGGVVVQMLDVNGNPATNSAGTNITLSLVTGSGTLMGTLTQATAVNGQATFANVSIQTPTGSYSLQAAATGLTSVTSGAFNLNPGPAAVLVFVNQPVETEVTDAIGTDPVSASPPSVQVQDAYGNNRSDSGTSVYITVVGAGVTLGGVTTSTTSSGLVTFSDLVPAGSTATVQLQANSTGLTAGLSSSFQVDGVPVDTLVFTTQPTTTTAGVTMAEVDVTPYYQGSPAGAGVGITLSLGSGTGTLAGTLTQVTGGSGVAQFTDLSLTVAGLKQLLASAGSVSYESASFTISAASASQLVIATQPGASAVAGAPIATQPVLWVEDAYGNVASNSIAAVSAEELSGGNISGSSGNSVSVNADGVTGTAAFSGLYLTNAAPDKITFTSAGLTGATSSVVTVTASVPGALTMHTQPSATANAGVALAQQPAVNVFDAYGNNVSNNTPVVVTASVGNVQGTTTQNTTSGLASYTNLALTNINSGSPITLTFTVGSASVVSSGITVSGGPVTQLIWATPPSGASYGTPFATQPVIETADVYGNPSTSGLGTQQIINVSLSGSGMLSGVTNYDIGTAGTNGSSGTVNCSGLSVIGSGSATLTVSPGNGLAPASLPACVVWLDASDTSTIVGANPVTAWNDKSGYGNNYNNTINVGGSTGAIKSGLDTINGRNVVLFPGNASTVGIGLATTSLHITTNSLSIFVLVRETNTRNTWAGACGLTTISVPDYNSLDLNAFSGNGVVERNNQDYYAGAVPALNTPYMIAGVFNGGATTRQSYLVDKASDLSASESDSVAGNFNITWASIGCRLGAGAASVTSAGSDPWVGDVAEFLLYTNVISAANHAAVDTYLTNKWFPVITSSGATTFTVAPATLTVTATATNQTYGAAVTPVLYTITGYLNGDSSSLLTGSPTLTASIISNCTPAGTYTGAIVLTQGSLAGVNNGTNYTFTLANGTLTVNPATLTITPNAASQTYGTAATLTANYSGFQCSDGPGSLSTPVTLTPNASACSPVGGSYTITASGAVGANYNISYGAPAALTVNPAALTLTANSASRIYGAPDPTYSGAYSGYTSSCGDNSGNVTITGTPTFTSNDSPTSPPGSAYLITPNVSGLSAANYTFAAATGTLTISQANSTNTLVATPAWPATGADVQLTNTLSAVPLATGTPTGMVNIATNGVYLATGLAIDGNGVSYVDTSLLPHGSNYVTVEYAGDGNFIGSTNTIGLIVNTAPTNSAQTAGIGENTPLVLSTLKIMAAAYDADGDTLSITNVVGTSTNGGTVILSGDFSTITYTPVANYLGSDEIIYYLSDTWTNVAEPIYVNVTNTNNQTQNILAVTNNGNGTVTLTLAGVPGYSYHIQATTNLTSGIWTNLYQGGTSAPAGGIWSYTDPFASNFTTHFYRTVSP